MRGEGYKRMATLDPRLAAAYTIAEAGRYLKIPLSALRQALGWP